MANRNILLCTAFVFAAGLRPAAASDNVSFTVVDLGTLAGGTWSSANAINNQGEVVGVSSTASGQGHAVLWTKQRRKIVDLHPEGFISSTATCINASGQVVVRANSAAGAKTFIWSQASGFTALALPASATVFGINASGRLVGTWSRDPLSANAFFWTPQGGFQDLAPSSPSSGAYAVNDRGEIAGSNCVPGDRGPCTVYHAFLWSRQGAPQDLDNDRPGSSSFATAINQRGDVVGKAYRPPDPLPPFLWTPREGIKPIGDVWDNDWDWVTSINVHREVVGYTLPEYPGIQPPGQTAFYWTEEGGAETLPDLPGQQGWFHGLANSINDWGEIVGVALAPNGERHAALWTRSHD